MNYEAVINELFNRVVRYLRAQPLNLGGYATVSGGGGGPPGGFQGYLPQTRVTFDESEADTWPIPSGPTLVDNLNRIRYRLTVLEASGVGGSSSGVWNLVVEDDSEIVLSGVTVLDFTGSLTVTPDGAHKIIVSGAPSSSITVLDDLTDVNAPSPIDGEVLTWDSGTNMWINAAPVAGSGTTSSGTGEILTDDSILVRSITAVEDLTSQIPTTSFTTISGFVPGTLKIYYNGIRQREVNYTEGISSFTTSFTTYSGDSMLTEYDVIGYSISTILFDDNGDVIYEN